eukprot:scaffold21205_cov107-Phaeocystis_antarctica.AAC.3
MKSHTMCKCTPGLTAWRVIYRRAACQLRDQMCSPDDDLSARSGPAFEIATCGKLRAKEDHALRRWNSPEKCHIVASYAPERA